MNLIISQTILTKMESKSPPVSKEEIIECFANRTRTLLTDTRAQHLTNPLTRWFVSETNHGIKIKIMYVPMTDGLHVKSAYRATDEVIRIYNTNSEEN